MELSWSYIALSIKFTYDSTHVKIFGFLYTNVYVRPIYE